MKKLDEALLVLLGENNIFPHIVKYFSFAVDEKCPTAYVVYQKDIQRFKVGVGREFMDSLSVDSLAAVLEHEISHVLLSHLSRVSNRDKRLWNIAADLYINETSQRIKQFLKPVLPEGVWTDTVKVKEGERIDLQRDSVEDIYLKLDTSCQNDTMDEHDMWEGMSGSEEEIREVINRMMGEAEKRGERGSGGIDKVVERVRGGERVRRTVNRLLNKFSTTFIKKSHNSTPTWSRPSRRIQASDFLTRGRIRKTLLPHILIGIDWSGSMVQHEPLILQFLNQLKNLNCSFDLTIGDVKEILYVPYPQPIPKRITSIGGGTDLSFIANRFKTQNYDGAIIFTDGEVDWSQLETFPIQKTIVLLTQNTQCPFQNTIKIE